MGRQDDKRRALEQVVEKHSTRIGKLLLVDSRELAQAYLVMGPRGMVSMLNDMIDVDAAYLEGELDNLSNKLASVQSTKPALKTVEKKVEGYRDED